MGKKTFQQLVWEPRCGSAWLSVLPGWGCDNIELSAGSSATSLSGCSQASESVGVAEGTQGPDSCPEPFSPVWGAGHIRNNSWTRDRALLFVSWQIDPGPRWLLLGPCALLCCRSWAALAIGPSYSHLWAELPCYTASGRAHLIKDNANSVPMCYMAALFIGKLFLRSHSMYRKGNTFTFKKSASLGVLLWSSLYTIMKQEKFPASSPPGLSTL